MIRDATGAGHGGYLPDSVRTHLVPCASIPGAPNTPNSSPMYDSSCQRRLKYPDTCQCAPRPAYVVEKSRHIKNNNTKNIT